MRTEATYNNHKKVRYDMPWGLLIFLSGLILHFVKPEYSPLDFYLMVIGGAIFVLGLIFFMWIFTQALRTVKQVRRSTRW